MNRFPGQGQKNPAQIDEDSGNQEDIEKVEDGLNRKLLIFPNDDGRDAIVERLKGAVEKGSIQDMIWTTPGLPMLIFITVGLIIALFFGDIIWILIRLLFV